MPNARPTQPGYYWARVRGGRRWVPVEMWRLGVTDHVAFFSDGNAYGADFCDLEWGPAIPEYRGEGGG